MDLNLEFEKNKKLRMAMTIIATVAVIGGFCCSNIVHQKTVVEQGLVGLVISALIGVIVAVNLLPTIGNQTSTLESDTTNFSASERSLVGLWPLLIIVGVMMGIISIAL